MTRSESAGFGRKEFEDAAGSFFGFEDMKRSCVASGFKSFLAFEGF